MLREVLVASSTLLRLMRGMMLLMPRIDVWQSEEPLDS